MSSSASEPDPHDPDLDRPCTSCRAHFHPACFGWWRWCPCSCGLTADDPRTRNGNQHQGDT